MAGRSASLTSARGTDGSPGAAQGHQVAAVDLLVNQADGLGAHVHYESRFMPVQAELDSLPFGSGQADLVVYNGAVHYSTDYAVTLTEGLRVLASDGVLAVVDSPIYRDASSGRHMLRERAAEFERTYGFASDALPSEGFLTWARLDDLGHDLGVEWTVFRPWYGWRWALRPWRARLRKHREPAAFAVVAGCRTGARVGRSRREQLLTPFVRVRYALARRRSGRLAIEQVGNLDLVVLPGVFNPVLMRSGAAFARLLDDRLVPRGSRVLELGTGSGVVAIRALGWAATAVATDINPAAVRCAMINAMLNDVASRLDVREGDLFAPVAGERFDRVLFNPPFFRGDPRDPPDRAWRSSDVPERFAAGLCDHLAPGGCGLLLLSSHGDASLFLDSLRASGFAVDVAARASLTNETVTIYRLTPERSEPC
ncbi:MAG TPA: methyltransferase domain-containing protein [Thermomicrobiales bacterium]|nr:methyltransferase domain-containing protein [Thermomicrobiales bacterium]